MAEEKYSNFVIQDDLISVVILTYQRPDLLDNLIKSLRLNTDCKAELIIIDGGSSKENQQKVYEIVENSDGWSNRHIYYSIKNSHSNELINKGFELSRGKYVFIGNDDIICKTKFWAERMISHLENHPDAGIIGVSSNSSYQKQNSNILETEKHKGEVGESDQIAGIFALIPREVWRELEGYDENLSPRCGGDSDYSIRCRAYGYKLYFAKDVYFEHLHFGKQDNWLDAYKYNRKKYGVDYITEKNGEQCVQKAKEIYKPKIKSKPKMNEDAIGIWFYHGTIIEKTIDSLVYFTPPEIPIYVMEQSAPSMAKERDRLNIAVAKHGGRVKIHRCHVANSRKDAPLSIIKFLNDHPEINNLLKIDDDFIVCSDIFNALKDVHYSRPDTLWTQAMCPLNIIGLDILRDRVPSCSWFTDHLIDPERMYQILQKNNQLVYEIWRSTVPPEEVLFGLRSGKRIIESPNCRRCHSASHYFARREDIINVGGIWDEAYWQKMAEKTKRPRLLDTWTIAYHLAWFPATAFALAKIVPEIIDKTDFGYTTQPAISNVVGMTSETMKYDEPIPPQFGSRARYIAALKKGWKPERL